MGKFCKDSFLLTTTEAQVLPFFKEWFFCVEIMQTINYKNPSIFRHLGAIFYDSLLIFSLWILLGFIFVGLNKGEPILSGYKLVLLRISYLLSWGFFYAYFISQQGQSLGMRAWKLFIAQNDKKPNFLISLKRWAIAVLVYFSSPIISLALDLKIYLAAIFLIIMFIFNEMVKKLNQKNCSLIDLLSNTKLILLEKNPYVK